MIFVAEIGSSHRGQSGLAYELIRQASLAGADIVKFQLGHFEGSGELQAIRRWATTHAKFLFKTCRYFNIEFMSSIFSTEGLETAQKLGQKRYKFASRDAFSKHSKQDYDTLLYEVLKLGRITYISDSKVWAHRNARMLHCVPCYPTFPGDLVMPKSFPGLGYYGYSSHMHGIEDALLSIFRGSKLVEKHLTLDRSGPIKDDYFALAPEEFAEMVRVGRRLEKLIEHCNSIG
jgi:sialic acid synthase SpsE